MILIAQIILLQVEQLFEFSTHEICTHCISDSSVGNFQVFELEKEEKVMDVVRTRG